MVETLYVRTASGSPRNGPRTQERVHLDLGSRSYNIVIGTEGLIDTIAARVRELEPPRLPRRCLVVSSPRIWQYHGKRLGANLDSAKYDWVLHTIPDGEDYKTLESLGRLYDALFTFERDQEFFLLSFGGGVVGDVAGYAAATFRRGIQYVQVPTTLLAHVDCAVGGKVGVNLPGGKNYVGTFYQPRAVFADVSLLHTLPIREIRCGLAETIKYGAVCDRDFFTLLESHVDQLVKLDDTLLVSVVRRACELKAAIVHQDERDVLDIRAKLNFGHTFAHALESATSYTGYEHGEAVAIGMLCACDLGVQLGLLRHEDAERLEHILARVGLPTHAGYFDLDKAMEAMLHDKKTRDGKIRIVMMTSLGESTILPGVPEEQLRSILSGRVRP